MAFTPPKRDIVEMMTPQKEPTSTAITPYKENRSLLDFVMGGTPQKTTQQLKNEKDISRIKVIKNSTKPKYIFEYNTLKSGLTGQPNPNPKIASSILNRAMKSKLARNQLENKKNEVAIKLQKQKEDTIKLQKEDTIKLQKQKEDASHRIQAFAKNKLTKQYREAKKDLKITNTGEPLVVNQNTKELILKKNRDRGLKHNKQQHLKNVLQNKKKLLILLNLC